MKKKAEKVPVKKAKKTKPAKAEPVPAKPALPKGSYVKVTDINAQDVWLNPALIARLSFDSEQSRVEAVFSDGQVVRIPGTVEDLLK